MPTGKDLDTLIASLESRTARSGAVNIHYYAVGSGRPVVFLHGFPDHSLGWWKQIEALKNDYRVLAIDLRGYNLSDKPEETGAYHWPHLVDDLVAVLDHEGLSDATIVGHDWGGYVAWRAAMTVPARVRSLGVLAMPHPGAIAAGLRANPDQRRSSDYVWFFQSPDAHLRYPPARLGFWVQDEAFANIHQAAMNRSSLKAMFDYYRENFPRPPAFEDNSDYPPVTVPTLLIHGRDDPYALPAGVRDTFGFVAGDLSVHLLSNAGHFLPQHNSEAVNCLLAAWLKERG